MAYSLFRDKSETFEAKIHIDGASLNESFCRLVVESDEWNLVFKGDIDKDGNCNIPIKKLKNVMSEGTVGTMKLEVIAEDTYFVPWETDFEVDTAKTVRVEVKQQTNTTQPKASIVIKEQPTQQSKQTIKKPIKETTNNTQRSVLKHFTKQLMAEGITIKNARTNLDKINEMSNDLLFTHNITEDTRKQVVNKSMKLLSRKSKL